MRRLDHVRLTKALHLGREFARECACSQQNEVRLLQVQTPERERALFERLRVRRDARVRIGFRRRQRKDLRRRRFFPAFFYTEGAVPETQIIFPRFEVTSCLRDDGERFSGVVLQRSEGQRARRACDEAADRNDARIRPQLVEKLPVLARLRNLLQSLL